MSNSYKEIHDLLNLYNIEFICTYQEIDDEEDSDDLYRIQFMQAFNQQKWEDNDINHIVENLYETIGKTHEISVCLEKIIADKDLGQILNYVEANKYGTAFQFLFGYKYFSQMHRCICDFLTTGKIEKSSYENLLNKF